MNLNIKKDVQQVLKNYFAILSGKEAKFQIAKKKGILAKKIEQAYKLLESCELCERKCRVNRIASQEGFCRLQNKMLISSYFDHYGEEPFFVPSFTIFFWSCNFSCQYCQNWTISHRYEKPREMRPEKLAKIIDEHNYCKNINFVGGEPTPQLPFILKTLSYVESNLPVIWNSNFYMSKISMNLLKGIVDVYLSDFKYGNDNCALELSKVENYTSVVKRNHLLAARDAEIVIRHLVLPGHLECCTKPILEWIAKNLKNKAIVNIMDQYRPEFLAYKFKDINRFLTAQEFDEAIDYAKTLGLNFIC
ncbi:MAG: radical SAM protein [Candidatus Pacearchaeota archaeon]